MKYRYLAVLFVLSTLFAENALALRCSNKLIMSGDYVTKMYKYCGTPDAVLRDNSIRGDKVVYIYKMNGRNQIITTIDNVIRDMRSE